MLYYKINQLDKFLNAKLYGNPELFITSVVIDSREVSLNPNSLFFALVGDNHDGHSFIGELHLRGVNAFVVSKIDDLVETYPNASFLLVNNTLEAFQQLAANHRSTFSYPVLGITGSNGKTIVKEWLAQVLSSDFKVVRSPKSYNSQVGVPLSVFLMAPEFDLALLEAGISRPGEMDKLQSIISPDLGIFTNLGGAHQENFAHLETKAREKMQLFKDVKTLIYCKDHHLIDKLAQEQVTKRGMETLTWGEANGSDLKLVYKERQSYRLDLVVQYSNDTIKFSIPFTDDASVENAMHCLCAAVLLGVELGKIPALMEKLQPVAMRLELKEGVNGCTLINDSYNSDLGSLSIALDYLAQQRQQPKRMLVLSDILQSGREAGSLYGEVARMVNEKGVDKFIGIGKDICQFSHLFKPNSEFYPSTPEFLSSFARQSFRNSAILLKGSRPFQFEKISALLEQKTHRTLLEINLNALVHNLNYFRSLIKPKVKVMVMVKAFSYGSGSFEIANLLQFHRVDYLGVAFTDEGIALREAGITLPIVVLNPEFGSYELMIEYKLEPELFSLSSLNSFASAVSRMGLSSYPVHLKIDTGMHRLGFMPDEIPTLIEKLGENKNIKVQSIFSHLVATDEADHDGFTSKQIQLFEQCATSISNAIGYKPMLHILNSAGIERFPNAQFDMIRLGIGLYGISAVHQDNLQVVSTLKTFIAQLRELPAEETVGYNRSGQLTRKSIIATIPIGYADGLNRRLSNGVGKVMVNGALAPIAGKVSMDLCMIDVTDIANVKEGDEVIVFGENPSISETAKALSTIPYEVLTSISRRVKRVYMQE